MLFPPHQVIRGHNSISVKIKFKKFKNLNFSPFYFWKLPILQKIWADHKKYLINFVGNTNHTLVNIYRKSIKPLINLDFCVLYIVRKDNLSLN